MTILERSQYASIQNLYKEPGGKLNPLPPVKGTLDLLVLKALTWGPMHGFEVTSWLERQSGGELDLQDSALYQALYRMEKRGLVRAEWGTTDNNRRARYYRITGDGRRFLAREAGRFLSYARTVGAILRGPARPAGRTS